MALAHEALSVVRDVVVATHSAPAQPAARDGFDPDQPAPPAESAEAPKPEPSEGEKKPEGSLTDPTLLKGVALGSAMTLGGAKLLTKTGKAKNLTEGLEIIQKNLPMARGGVPPPPPPPTSSPTLLGRLGTKLARVPWLRALGAGAAVALAGYDAYRFVNTLQDPKASTGQKALRGAALGMSSVSAAASVSLLVLPTHSPLALPVAIGAGVGSMLASIAADHFA
jgi:hypothetical protein